MNAERLVPLVLVIVCLAAIGGTAASLTSAVKTTPDDVIDLSGVSLPIGDDQLQAYDRRLNGDPTQAAADSTSEPQNPADEQQVSDRQRSEERRRAQQADGQRNERREVSAGGQGTRQSTQRQGTRPPTLLERLLALLRALLDALLALLPVLGGVLALALAVRYRHRLVALVDREDDAPGESTQSVDAPGAPSPRNDIERAWWEVVTALGVERPETRTPRECVAAASADAERVVGRLTEAFEEVRYGHAEVTEEHRRRVREARQWLQSRREDRA